MKIVLTLVYPRGSSHVKLLTPGSKYKLTVRFSQTQDKINMYNLHKMNKAVFAKTENECHDLDQAIAVKLKRWTYIIRCGKYSIRQVVEGEIRICIYFNEGHFLFGRGSTHNLMELLSEWAAAVDNFQMWNFGQARLPLHSQSYSSRAILPNPGFNANHLAKWLSKTQIQTPDNRTCNYFTFMLFVFLF